MATIALYANQMNLMPDLLNNIKYPVMDYKSELLMLKEKTLTINSSICNLDDVISMVKTSTQTQDEKITALDEFKRSNEEFIAEAARIDGEVAQVIRQRQEDFYEQYYYLKPECEKSMEEAWLCNYINATVWCREHWKEILITVVLVIGAVAAIAAIFCSGFLALAPILTTIVHAFGMTAGTAMTIGTVASVTISFVAVGSTLASLGLDLVDTWCDMDDNPTFKSWQTAMRWTCSITNGIYGVGSIYNSVYGITNKSLRKLFRIQMGRNPYSSQISTAANTTALWSGFGRGGAQIAADAAEHAGKETLEMVIERADIKMPEWCKQTKVTWENASAAFAWNSSGEVTVFLGESVRSGSVWRTVEYPLLRMNPKVTNIITGSGFIERYFSRCSFLSGIESLIGAASKEVVD